MRNAIEKKIIFKTAGIIIIISCFMISSCGEKYQDFFRDPPVTPLTKTIKTSLALGYAAAVANCQFNGFEIPYSSVYICNNTTVIYINPGQSCPYCFSDAAFQEMVILAIKLSDDIMIMTVLFTHLDIFAGSFILRDVSTVPVIIDDEKITIVYTEQDINIGNPSDTTLSLNLTQGEIDFELSRLNFERPADEYVAIEQNAWIIDVMYHGSINNFYDDTYTINGGAQKVEICTQQQENSSSVYQLAMIMTEISPFVCQHNPKSGFALLQVVDMTVDNSDVLNELVLGQALFIFHDNCDGKVEITLGTGNYLTSTGSQINLGL